MPDGRERCVWMLVLITLGLGALQGAVRAQGLTGFVPGAKLEGSLGAPEEIDDWRFLAVAGSELSLKLAGDKGLSVQVSVIVEQDSSVLAESGVGSKLKLKKIVLPSTGAYRLRLTSFSESVGSYKMATKLALPKDVKAKQKVELLLSGGAVESLPVLMPSAGRLKLTVKPGKKSDASPAIQGLIGDGPPVAISSAIKVGKKGQSLKGAVVPAAGEYDVLVGNAGETGAVRVTWKVLRPKKQQVALEGVDSQVQQALSELYDSSSDMEAGLNAVVAQMGATFDAAESPAEAGRSLWNAVVQSLSSKADMQALIDLSLSGSLVTPLPPVGGSPSGDPGFGPGVTCEAGTTVFYINGVDTTKITGWISALELEHWFHAQYPDLAESVRFEHFYNPTGVSGEAYLAICGPILLAAAISGAGDGWIDGLLDSIQEYIQDKLVDLCAQLHDLPEDLEVVFDFLEAFVQWVGQVLSPPPSLPLAATFRDHIRQELASGQTVVVVAHSQGNLYAREALSMLDADEQQAVGVVGVASPTDYPGSGSYGWLSKRTLEHDAILLVPGAASATLTNQLTTSSVCPLVISNPLLLKQCLQQRYVIHGFRESYLAYSSSRTPMLADIAQAVSTLTNDGQLLGQGYLQVTLNWNIPGDMDLHVFEPTGDHVYYANKQGSIGELDFDDIPGDGPENYFVCEQQDLLPGSFDVYVNNYNRQTGTLATVSVKAGSQLQDYQVVAVPASQGGVLQPVVRIQYSIDGTFSLLPLN